MKKLLLLSSFLSIFVVGLNAQNDFRKMNWGESSKVLTEKYPEVDFLESAEMGLTVYYHISYVSGLNTQIAFGFFNDVFVTGLYLFTPKRSSFQVKDFVKDFENVSSRLNSKYKMEREDVWYEDNSNVDLMGVDFYLGQGDVDLMESSLIEGILIHHTLINAEETISHSLLYTTTEFFEKVQGSNADDF